MPVTSRTVHRDAPVAYENLVWYVGSVTATTSNIVRFRVPRDAVVHQLQLSASAASGTSPTLSAALVKGASTLVSTGNLTGAGVVTASPTGSATVLAGETIQVNLTAGGTSPSFSNVVIAVTLRKAGPDFRKGTGL